MPRSHRQGRTNPVFEKCGVTATRSVAINRTLIFDLELKKPIPTNRCR